jgi:hypothetical protein
MDGQLNNLINFIDKNGYDVIIFKNNYNFTYPFFLDIDIAKDSSRGKIYFYNKVFLNLKKYSFFKIYDLSRIYLLLKKSIKENIEDKYLNRFLLLNKRKISLDDNKKCFDLDSNLSINNFLKDELKIELKEDEQNFINNYPKIIYNYVLDNEQKYPKFNFQKKLILNYKKYV